MVSVVGVGAAGVAGPLAVWVLLLALNRWGYSSWERGCFRCFLRPLLMSSSTVATAWWSSATDRDQSIRPGRVALQCDCIPFLTLHARGHGESYRELWNRSVCARKNSLNSLHNCHRSCQERFHNCYLFAISADAEYGRQTRLLPSPDPEFTAI